MGLADRLADLRRMNDILTEIQAHGPADAHPPLTALLSELPHDWELALHMQLYDTTCVTCLARSTQPPPVSWTWARDHTHHTRHREYSVTTGYVVRIPEGQDR